MFHDNFHVAHVRLVLKGIHFVFSANHPLNLCGTPESLFLNSALHFIRNSAILIRCLFNSTKLPKVMRMIELM